MLNEQVLDFCHEHCIHLVLCHSHTSHVTQVEDIPDSAVLKHWQDLRIRNTVGPMDSLMSESQLK